ncbi:MAG TPA: GGDEF domain-containing protein [Clostridium sp.]
MKFLKIVHNILIKNKLDKNFETELAKRNMVTAKIMMTFVIIFQVCDIMYTIFKKKNIYTFPNYAYMTLYISLFIATAIILLVGIKLSKNIEINAKKILILSIIYSGLILIWGTGITLLDLRNSAQIIVYITVVIGITATIYIKPNIAIIILSMNYLILLALIIKIDTIFPNYELVKIDHQGLYINITIFTIIGIVVSIVRYINKCEDFRNRLIIVSQNRKLNEMNNELNRLNGYLGSISKIDYLSKLNNRWCLDETMQEQLEICIENNTSLAVLMIDIDDFKKLNDSCGHEVGDNGIKMVSSIIKKYSEEFSLSSFRYGGEEFLILMPDFSEKDAYRVANDIRQDICRSEIKDTDINLTVSGGLHCCTPSINEEYAEFIVKSDRALYKAKEKGKNFIEIYEELVVLQV